MTKINREEIIKNLPNDLSPVNILDEIAAHAASDSVLKCTELAYLKFFASDEFQEYAQAERDNITYYYRILMDMLRKVKQFESITFGSF